MSYTPHADKLTALHRNPKLPAEDKPRLDLALEKYTEWKTATESARGTPEEVLEQFVGALNAYKKFIEFDFIFCSKSDFLYRQKGQLKLDNTILEEFFPMLIDKRIIPSIENSPSLSGPTKCFSGLNFSTFLSPLSKNGASIKSKDQDFAVGRKMHLQLQEGTESFSSDLNVAYFVCEIKTNLDKTMFQEASATAKELKSAVSGSKYYLACEWLDMTPIDTRYTSIDNVVVLRKAKRMNSNIRSSFSRYEGREKAFGQMEEHLTNHPIQLDCISHIVENIAEVVGVDYFSAEDALTNGYF